MCNAQKILDGYFLVLIIRTMLQRNIAAQPKSDVPAPTLFNEEILMSNFIAPEQFARLARCHDPRLAVRPRFPVCDLAFAHVPLNH